MTCATFVQKTTGYIKNNALNKKTKNPLRRVGFALYYSVLNGLSKGV